MTDLHPNTAAPIPMVTFGIWAALWCVIAIALVYSHHSENNAQAARAADPLEPFTVVVRTVPIVTDDFNDRWQLPITEPRTELRFKLVRQCPTRSRNVTRSRNTATRSAATVAADISTPAGGCPGGAGDE